MTNKLTEHERAVYEWQMWIEGFGEAGQEKLKGTTALVSRVGGLGGPLAQQLAAAGFGKIILAHGGNLKPSDLHRQIVMKHEGLGESRAEQARETLLRLNPNIEVEAVGENISDDNAARLVGEADIVFDCAPLFEERFLMNRECVLQGKPLIDCAMYSLEAQITTIVPGETPCLACLYPEQPPAWKREFPVFGAVSGMVACLGAMEGIKLISGIGECLKGELLYCDLQYMDFRRVAIERRADCAVCQSLSK